MNPEETALSRIREAAASGATALDLSLLGLDALPTELWELIRLNTLDLRANRITALPPELSELASLTMLNLSFNQITVLPPELWQLPRLVKLNISANPLPETPPELWQKTVWQRLGLGDIHLTSLPPEIGRLTSLTTLELWNNQLTTLPPEIGHLTSLTMLELWNNQLTTLPPEIGRLTSLTTLNLSENQLTALPPEIGRLTSLTTLNLSENQLTALPPELWQLPRLTKLDISANPLPEIPPELWQKTDWQSLELGRLNLTSLPPQIGKLLNLQILDLSENQLTSLPPQIGKLLNLRTLILWSNQLTSLPPELWQLPRLTELVISANPLPEIPPELWQKKDWQTLGLSSLNLTSLPLQIGQLLNLQTLNLGGNQLTSLPPQIGELRNLQTLNLWNNRLTSLPPQIGKLLNLQTLNLSRNQLTSLPPEISSLTALTELNLLGNQLTALPPEVGQLTSLTTLYLGVNHLTALPPEISNLTSLNLLDLSNNYITVLPPEIDQLTNLTWLDISSNRLAALQPEIHRLTNLTWLGISGNQLTFLPSEIGELVNLQTLNIDDNQLTSLPPQIGELLNLQTLNIDDNQLTSLPPELWQLPHLVQLNISFNPLPEIPLELWKKTDWQRLGLWGLDLTSLPPQIGELLNLQTLDLSYNQLTSLPPEMANLNNLERLNLHGNPLTLALPRALLGHEILGGGDAQSILRFYRAIWKNGKPLGEVRLLFVGQPAVGKTQLIRRLRGLDFQPLSPSTMTIETHALPLGRLTARFWDFGGQDFMHATHPFFFSARCVYVLVLNVRQTYEQNRVEDWLRLIRAFGGDSPVIVVGNHADADQHVLDLPENRLRGDFPNIAAFLQTSAKDARGLDALRAALEESAAALPHTRVLFAASHLAVRDALEQEKQQRDIIPYPRYADLCAAQGIADQADQRTLLALLHDLGVALDFRDEDGQPLAPDGILNPNWVTEAVYRLITDPQLRGETRGRLTPPMVARILHGYPPYHRDLMLKLMRRFELAYPAGDDWWLPNAMPQDEPPAAADPAWAQALTFAYEYDALPESVVTRFIVRASDWIEAGRVWRWGVILASGGNRALVRARPAEKRVEIHVSGPEHTRREMLALIRGHFDVIHRTFSEGKGKDGFGLREFLYPPQYPGLALNYQDLLIFERDGVPEITQAWQGRVIRLNVSDVLNGFVTPEARREERKRLFPEEERRMREEEEKSIHIEIHGDMRGSALTIGEGNQVRQTIQNSFNTPSNPELAPLLTQLTAAVEEMAKHLPAEQAAETREDLTRLQEELAKPKPQKKWYSVSIEGLKAAAKNVGEIGAPVLELAGKVLKLLG